MRVSGRRRALGSVIAETALGKDPSGAAGEGVECGCRLGVGKGGASGDNCALAGATEPLGSAI